MESGKIEYVEGVTWQCWILMDAVLSSGGSSYPSVRKLPISLLLL